MVLVPALAPAAGFAGLMAIAAFEDLRRFVVPNAVVLGALALWPLHVASAPGITFALAVGAAGCALAVFGAGAAAYSCGFVGGGDVKLLAVATLWAGPESTPALLVATAVLGGLLALVLLSWAWVRAAVAGAGAASASPAVPYGVAIAAAAVAVTLPPSLP
jgi:prepilin peptidase CpaA